MKSFHVFDPDDGIWTKGNKWVNLNEVLVFEIVETRQCGPDMDSRVTDNYVDRNLEYTIKIKFRGGDVERLTLSGRLFDSFVGHLDYEPEPIHKIECPDGRYVRTP